MRPSHHLRARAAVLGTALLAPAACRSYVPLAGAPPPDGREVRIELTDAGSVGLSAVIGPRARFLDGVLRASSDSVLVLSVHDVTRADGGDEPWTGERVALPRASVASLSTPRLSAGRTGIFAIGAAAVGVALTQIFGGSSGAGGRTSGGGGHGGA